MSVRYLINCSSINQAFRAVEFLAEYGVFDSGFVDKVYFSAKQFLKLVNEIKEGQKHILNLVIVENHGEVDVAVVVEAGGEYGAEYP